jgi:hypothetical protein
MKFKAGDGATDWATLPYIGTLEVLPVAPGDVPGHEQQSATAIAQMSEGGHLERLASQDAVGNPIAADSWDLAQAAYWAFTPAVDSVPGAATVFLDWWGSMLQVPRNPGESDDAYRQRIPITVMRPCTTNLGMALIIDQLLGLTGTLVVDAASYFSTIAIRLNDGNRMNDGLRLGPSLLFGVTATWNCFIVILPAEIPGGFTNEQINTLVDRIRAAGNRKIATFTPSTQYTP